SAISSAQYRMRQSALGGQRLPAPVDQHLGRGEATLVVHFRMSFDVEAEVQPAPPAAARPFDLAQDRQAAETAGAQLADENGVHRRQRPLEHAAHRLRRQPALAMQVDEARRPPAGADEAVEVMLGPFIQPAATMALAYIAPVHLEMRLAGSRLRLQR